MQFVDYRLKSSMFYIKVHLRRKEELFNLLLVGLGLLLVESLHVGRFQITILGG